MTTSTIHSRGDTESDAGANVGTVIERWRETLAVGGLDAGVLDQDHVDPDERNYLVWSWHVPERQRR